MSVQGEKLKAIADAIRAKKGTSEPIVADNFASEILSIPTGIEPSGTIEITENGTYNVAEYASANVNVSSGGGGSGKLAEFMSGTATEITAEDMKGATAIKQYALYYDTTIEKFHTGNTATTVGSNAVTNNSALKEITIGENVSDMQYRCFGDNSYVTKIIYNGVVPANKYTNASNAFLDIAKQADSCTLEINSEIVAAHLFRNMPYVTEVIINGKNGVCTLNTASIADCSKVKNVYINSDISGSQQLNFSFFAYTGDTTGSTVHLADVVKVIPKNFFKAAYFTQYNLNKIEEIGESAFDNMKVTTIQLPETLKIIGRLAFGYSKLTSIEIPASVTNIARQAFFGCTSMKKVVFKGQVPNILNNTFYNCPVTLYDFRNCTTVPTLASTDGIDYGAGCQIVIPDALYDEWTTATNWSALVTDNTQSAYVVWVKASEYVEV